MLCDATLRICVCRMCVRVCSMISVASGVSYKFQTDNQIKISLMFIENYVYTFQEIYVLLGALRFIYYYDA